MDVKLITVTSKGARKSFTLNGPMMTVGRQPDCEVQIPHGLISRQHCQIQVNEDKLFIRDMKSANGTYVNGNRVNYTELKAGDIITLGDIVKFIVQIDGLPSKIDDADLNPASPVGKPLKTEHKAQPEHKAQKTRVPAAQPSKPAAKPATQPAAPVEDEADELLGESFFMDNDEEEDEK
jgi:predicted component of type VI protein secretion system